MLKLINKNKYLTINKHLFDCLLNLDPIYQIDNKLILYYKYVIYKGQKYI